MSSCVRRQCGSLLYSIGFLNFHCQVAPTKDLYDKCARDVDLQTRLVIKTSDSFLIPTIMQLRNNPPLRYIDC